MAVVGSEKAGVTRGERIYFAAVGVLALWVGFWGYFVPSEVERAIPFSVPPLHARFLGAVYLSGLTIMAAGCWLAAGARSGSSRSSRRCGPVGCA